MPTHLTTPGYGPCGFAQLQWFTTDTTHLDSVSRRRPFQGSIWVAEECRLPWGGETVQPGDDYPPAKFGLTVSVKTHRLGMLRDWKVQPIGGIFGDSAEGKKGPQRCFEKEALGIVAKGRKRSPEML